MFDNHLDVWEGDLALEMFENNLRRWKSM